MKGNTGMIYVPETRYGAILMDFVLAAVEAVNPDLASICQIGFAEYQNGRLVRSWGWLVNPEDYFACMNISIHGIDDRAAR